MVLLARPASSGRRNLQLVTKGVSEIYINNKNAPDITVSGANYRKFNVNCESYFTTNPLDGQHLLEPYWQYYSQLGYKVFPVAKGKKNPACRNGVKDATADVTQLHVLFANTCNIGMSCEGMLAIDLDFVKDSTKSRDELQADLESARQRYDDGICPVSRTRSGGLHLVYRMPPELADNLKNWNKALRCGDIEVDLKKTGGYIVVAPSYVEADAKGGAGHYKWERHLVVFDQLPFPPQYVIDMFADIASKKNARTESKQINKDKQHLDCGDNDDPTVIERARKYLAKMPEAIGGQQGHNKLLQAATATAWGFGLSRETTFELLWGEYNCRCQPEWSEKEILHKIDEAMKTDHPNDRGYLTRSNKTTDGRLADNSEAESNSTPEPPEPFPVDALPDVLKDFAVEGARSHGSDIVFFVPVILSAVSGAMGMLFRVKIKGGYFIYPAIGRL